MNLCRVGTYLGKLYKLHQTTTARIIHSSHLLSDNNQLRSVHSRILAHKARYRRFQPGLSQQKRVG